MTSLMLALFVESLGLFTVVGAFTNLTRKWLRVDAAVADAASE